MYSIFNLVCYWNFQKKVKMYVVFCCLGVLLYGVLGIGKILLVRVCVVQIKLTFFKLVGLQLVQMFIGDGVKLVRDVFVLVKEKQLVIIFIDELDVIGLQLYFDDYIQLLIIVNRDFIGGKKIYLYFINFKLNFVLQE